MQIAVHCMAALWLICSALETSHLSWFCGPLIVRDPPAFPALKLLFNHQIVFSIMEINLPLRKLSEDTLGKLSTLRHCFRRCCHGPLSLSLVTLAYSIYSFRVYFNSMMSLILKFFVICSRSLLTFVCAETGWEIPERKGQQCPPVT